MAETTLRTPSPLVEESTPLVGTWAFSSLWVYHSARRYSAEQGRPVRGEGAIVTDALSAVVKYGLLPYDMWPSTDENYRAYSDAKIPGAAARATKIKIRGEARRLTDAEAILEHLAAGHSVQIGLPWRSGANRTSDDGRFAWAGFPVGGHAVELLGYDLDSDTLAVGNSWGNARWGVQPASLSDPRDYGFCRWSDFARDLTREAFSTGLVEAVVITEVDVPGPSPTPPGPAPGPPGPTPVPPTPTPPGPVPGPSPAPECKATLVIGSAVYAGTLRLVASAPSAEE